MKQGSIGLTDILGSTVKDGEVRANIGDATDGKGWGPETAMWGQYGFAARPADQTTAGQVPGIGAGNAMGLYYQSGSTKRVFAWRDNRFVKQIGDIEPGGSAQFNDSGSFHQIQGGTGTQTFYVPYAKDADGVPQKALSIILNSEDGNESITVLHGEGQAVVLTQDGDLLLRSNTGEARITLKGDQITMQAQKIIAQGNVVVGANPLGALPLTAGPASPPCPSLWFSPV